MFGVAVLATVIDGLEEADTVTESEPVTAAPVGGVPVAVAVFTTEPASTSDWVTVYVAEHVVVPAGANVVVGQDTADKPASGSLTPTPDNDTLPVLVTKNEYETDSPAAVTLFGVADLSTVIDGKDVAVTVTESWAVTAAPVGGVPLAVAVFEIVPASMSAWVTVYVAEQVVVAAGAKVMTGQVTAVRPGSGSLTAIPVRVTLPVFVTRKL